MRTHLHLGLFLIALALVGCGSRPPVPQGEVDDTSVRLGTTIDLDLAQLLNEDRATLAEKLESFADTAQAQNAARASKPSQHWLLPRLNTSNSALLHRPTFSTTAGFSLPEYNKAGKADAALAHHYARHGDFEAAGKLAPADQADASRAHTEKNYPIEWTLLVAMAQHLAEVKLIDGKPEGATDLAVIHKQLRDVLDAKAQAGPLGALLLPIGKQTLTDAASAWRKPGKQQKSALAEDIDAFVADWGTMPAAQPMLSPGTAKDTVTAVLGGTSAQGENLQRAIDLLALPVVRDGIDAIVAFFNDKGQLGELQVVYVGKINQRFPEPRHLAWPLVEAGGEGKAPPPKATLPRASFQGGPLVYDVTLLPRSNTLGAIVRVAVADPMVDPLTAKLPAQPLHFMPLQLDRSFETNRIALDRLKVVDTKRGLVIHAAEVIKTIQQPARDPLPAEVIVEREKDHDVVRVLHFRWKPSQNVAIVAGTRIAVPLWAAYGPATIEELEVAGSAALVLTWEQTGVLYALRLPYAETESINFTAAEKDHSAAALTSREKAAKTADQQDRAARLAIRKPIERIERSIFLPGVKLGQNKDDVMKTLPKNAEWQQQMAGNDVVLFNLTQPNADARPAPTAWPRQYIVRFDDKNKVAEIRCLYTEGPGRSEPGNPSLLDRLKLSNGEPQTIAATWSGLWSDLPAAGGTPTAVRWQDDVTTVEFQRDAFTVQVIVKDNPTDTTPKLQPLTTLGTGPEACPLGTTKTEVLKRWPAAPATTEGTLVLAQSTESRFDALIVTFEDGKAARVVGRLREPLPSGPGNLDGVLQRFYTEQPTLGLMRRRMPETTGQLRGGWGWHDDKVRVWAFGQETPEGPRVFVEWRYWPVTPTTTASR